VTVRTEEGGDVHSLMHAASALFGDWVGLVALEGRLAGLSAAGMLAFAILAGLCLFSAWLFLLGAVILLLAPLGYSWPGLLAAAAALNVLLAAALIFAIRKLSANLLFPATQQSLRRPNKEDTGSAAASPAA